MAKLNVPAEITRPLGLNYEATFSSSSYSMEDALIAKIDSEKEYEADRKKAFPSFEAAAKAVMGRRIVVR
jgi:hypothetical protein